MNVHARLEPRYSHIRRVPNFHELSLNFWLEPSSTSLTSPLFKDSLLVYAFSTKLSWTGLQDLTEPSSTSILFNVICKGPGDTAQVFSLARFSASHINFLELAYKIWHEPSSTSLLFSAICKGSGETAPMCSLVWSFEVRYAISTKLSWTGL